MLRLTLLSHAPTAAMRRAVFPADEPAESQTLAGLAGLAACLPRHDRAFTSPALRARQTTEALGIEAGAEPALADLDHGPWAGHGIADIAASEPKAFEAFMRDDIRPPQGGETVAALKARLAAWMERQSGGRGHTVAVTHAAVIRCAVLLALEAPAAAFWRIDVEPLSLTDLRFDGRRWALRSLNRNLTREA
ncbi:histidine phosphatase family protein [Xanthobacter sediminis]|uniref:histidine phosphatase family protein n=1 Tax=Xanthobacter sediminis TaxID=3119926 RepID=UPI00372AC4B1